MPEKPEKPSTPSPSVADAPGPSAKPSPKKALSAGETCTPAPWKVEDGGFVGGPVGYGRICQTWNKYEEDFQNSRANARLIAAAPELYAALKGAAKYLTEVDWRKYSLSEHHDLQRVQADVRVALAKARGETDAG